MAKSKEAVSEYHAQMGRTGGVRVVEIYGRPHMSEIGAMGRAVVAERYPDLLQRIASSGGTSTMERYGRKHFSILGKKGAEIKKEKRRKREEEARINSQNPPV